MVPAGRAGSRTHPGRQPPQRRHDKQGGFRARRRTTTARDARFRQQLAAAVWRARDMSFQSAGAMWPDYRSTPSTRSATARNPICRGVDTCHSPLSHAIAAGGHTCRPEAHCRPAHPRSPVIHDFREVINTRWNGMVGGTHRASQQRVSAGGRTWTTCGARAVLPAKQKPQRCGPADLRVQAVCLWANAHQYARCAPITRWRCVSLRPINVTYTEVTAHVDAHTNASSSTGGRRRLGALVTAVV